MLRSGDQLPWIARLETELDNIRAALARSVAARDEAEAGALVLAVGWFWWLRNYRPEGAEWVIRVLDLSTPEGSAQDPYESYVADPEADARHPLHGRRMDLRMLNLFLRAESELLGRTADGLLDERMLRYMKLIQGYFAAGGPQAARMPGLIWPLTAYFLTETMDIRPAMEAAVVNVRAHGGDWENAVLLMFRTHLLVDSPGGMAGIDEDLKMLKVLGGRVGDRWVRAQVSSAVGEAAMVRGRFEEARTAYEEALELAYEVGAYTETPFLIARLAELAFRAGDRDSALAGLDEATEESERHGVPDARAFVLMLRANIALEDGDIARARELCDRARAQSEKGTPPPQFRAGLNGIAALVTAAESGPGPGLAMMTATLREAVEQNCADALVGMLVDQTALLSAQLGELPRAVRLLAVGDHWRGGHPRPMPERARVERTETTARADLGVERYAAERARGETLTMDEVLAELTGSTSTAGADSTGTSAGTSIDT
jgi:tetratricopeptide (TPR) repeat protein